MMSVHVARYVFSGCLVTWLLGMGLVQGERELCSVAQSRCVSRIGCSMALSNVFLNCGQLIHGETDQCDTRCKKSLISLLSTDDKEGEAYMNCDCGGSAFCENQRARMEVCSKDVIPAMKNIYDDNTIISCSLAELICRADTPCLTALEFYERHCTKLWRGEKCTARCNNSLDILYRQQKAKKLRTCACDGTEDYPVPCETMQEYTEALCFGRHRCRHRHRHNSTTCPSRERATPQEEDTSQHDNGNTANNDTDSVSADRFHEPSHSSAPSVTLQIQYSSLTNLAILISWTMCISRTFLHG